MQPLAPHALQLEEVVTVIAAFVAYALFTLTAAVVRIGRGPKPILPFNRLHFRMTWVYLVLAAVALQLAGTQPGLGWVFELAVGAFFYLGLHYAIFVHFFGMAHASVSTSIISIVYRKGGLATRPDIVTGYAGGEGFEYIKRSRLDRLETFLGWVERAPDGAGYRVTPTGQRAIRTTRFFLKGWSLTQLGGDP